MSAGGRFPYPGTLMGNLSRRSSAPVVGEALQHRGSVNRLRAARDERPRVRHLVVRRGARGRFGAELLRHAAAEAGDEVVPTVTAAAAAPARRVRQFAHCEEHRVGCVYHADMLAARDAPGKVPEVTGLPLPSRRAVARMRPSGRNSKSVASLRSPSKAIETATSRRRPATCIRVVRAIGDGIPGLAHDCGVDARAL